MNQIPALWPLFSRFKIEPDEAVGRLWLQGEFRFRARHVALPRDASLEGSAVERILAAAEPRNAFLARRKKNRSGGFGWIIGIMMTTGLARLGAPFWYNAISGISSVAQRAHAARKAAQPLRPASFTESPSL